MSAADWHIAPDRTARVFSAAQYAPAGTYGISELLRVPAVLDAHVLGESVEALVEAHPDLRAELVVVDDHVWRRTRARESRRWLELLRHAGQDEDALAAELTDRGWALAGEGVLFSARLLHEDDVSWVHLFAHHAVVDGTGMGALVDELFAFYDEHTKTVQDKHSGLLAAQADVSGARTVPTDAVPGLWCPDVTTADVAALARELRVTTTAWWVAAVRAAAASAWRWRLDRVTVPMAANPDSLLGLDLLPLVADDSRSRDFARAVEAEADRLYEAVDLGPPLPELLGPLTSSVLPGVPDCLVSVAPLQRAPMVAGVDARRVPTPVLGAPAVLAVELTPLGTRISGHPDVVAPADLLALVEALRTLVRRPGGDADPEQSADLQARPITLGGAREPERPSAPSALLIEVLGIWLEFMKDLADEAPAVVAPHDSLQSLGVHSFQAARLVARLRGHFGSVVTLRALYRNPTPHEFALWLDAARGQR